MKKILYLAILIISAYQLTHWLDPSMGGCNIGGFDCLGVTSSKYGTIFGIPISVFAIIWSSLGLILSSGLFTLILSGLGLVATLYSLTIMGLVLHKWCFWCLIIDACIIGISFLSLIDFKKYKTILVDKKEIFLGSILSLVIISLSFTYNKLKPSVNQEQILSLDSSLVLGNLSGANTLLVFTDFECPACKNASELIQKIIKKGDTKVLVKNYPLSNECNNSVNHNMHPWSCIAAVASECAFEQGKFDEFYHTIYGNQSSIKTKADFFRTLSFTSLNMSQLESCIRGSWAENKVQQDIQIGNKMNIQGTPAIFYNGKAVSLYDFLNER